MQRIYCVGVNVHWETGDKCPCNCKNAFLLPALPHCILHTASDQQLAVGMARNEAS